ncbi:MAG: NAD-dependent epimerase/dehydratase family protein [Pseudomonadota bacterium]
MRIILTGGTGFLGRAMVDRLLGQNGLGGGAAPLTELVLIARRPEELPSDPRLRVVKGDFRDVEARRDAIGQGVDCVFHFASMMAKAAEMERDAAYEVNIASSLAFMNELRHSGTAPRVVYASSIGVYGDATKLDRIDDDTKPLPTISYGTDKLINELYLNDLSRRGELDGISLRLPACLPRPRMPDDTPSPDFASSVFHALKAGDSFRAPVSPAAMMWFLSLPCFIDNLMLAARLPASAYADRRVLQMPAQHMSMGDLVEGIEEALGLSGAGRVSWHPQPGLEERLAKFPPLFTPAADALGLTHDGDRATLIRRTLESI